MSDILPPPDAERIPDIWLRAFYGFDPTTDGYIGWTKEGDRDFMLRGWRAVSHREGQCYLGCYLEKKRGSDVST